MDMKQVDTIVNGFLWLTAVLLFLALMLTIVSVGAALILLAIWGAMWVGIFYIITDGPQKVAEQRRLRDEAVYGSFGRLVSGDDQ